jgi:hypothetical protein
MVFPILICSTKVGGKPGMAKSRLFFDALVQIID